MVVKVKCILEEISMNKLKGRWEGPDSGGYTEYHGENSGKRYLISGLFNQYQKDSQANEVKVSRRFALEGACVSISELRKLKAIIEDTDVIYSISREELILSRYAKTDEDFSSSFGILERTLNSFLPEY